MENQQTAKIQEPINTVVEPAKKIYATVKIGKRQTLNIRSKPNEKSDVLGQFKNGQKVEVFLKAVTNNDYYCVAYNDKKGYCNKKYMIMA